MDRAFENETKKKGTKNGSTVGDCRRVKSALIKSGVREAVGRHISRATYQILLHSKVSEVPEGNQPCRPECRVQLFDRSVDRNEEGRGRK